MKNSKIESIVKNAKKHKKIDPEILRDIKDGIPQAISDIKNIIDQNPNITESELREQIVFDIYNELKEYTNIANVSGRFYQLEAAKNLIEDKNLFAIEYAKVRNAKEKDKEPLYDANINKSYRVVLNEAINIAEKRKQSIENEIAIIAQEHNLSDEKLKKVVNELTKKRKDVKDYLGQIDSKLVYKVLEENMNIYEEHLKEIEINSLQFIYKRFKKYNLLDTYSSMSKSIMREFEIEEYANIPNEVKKGDVKTVNEIFSREYLEKQDLETLTMLSAFWQNRYSKECRNLGNALFALDTTDSIGEILQGKEKIEFSEEEINAIANKMVCLSQISDNMFDIWRTQIKANKQKGQDKNVEIERNTLIDIINKQEGDNYKKAFQERLNKSNNNLAEDLLFYTVILNQKENIYHIRNNLMGCKVRSLFNSKKCKNWGIIEDEMEEKKKKGDYVLIGIDQEDLNMPVRLHMSRDLLLKYIKTFDGATKLPVYEGSQDFVKKKKTWNEQEQTYEEKDVLLTTHVLMPMQKWQKELLNRYAKDTDSSEKRNCLIEHLRFLKDKDKFPEHLKEKIKKGNKELYARKERVYIDLKDNRKYQKINDKFIPLGKEENTKDTKSH